MRSAPGIGKDKMIGCELHRQCALCYEWKIATKEFQSKKKPPKVKLGDTIFVGKNGQRNPYCRSCQTKLGKR